jgi:23S rRNA (guanine745-N1)-methyltransferase
MNAFGPRNLRETVRVLSRGAVFLLLALTARHLGEVREPLGMLRIDAAKADRVAASTSGLKQLSADTLDYTANLTRLDLSDLVAMGPSAYHVQPSDLERRVGALASAPASQQKRHRRGPSGQLPPAGSRHRCRSHR